MEQVARHTATLRNDKTLRLFCGTSTFICFQLLSHPPAYSSPSPDLFSHSPSRVPLLQSQFLLTVPPSTAVTVPSPHSPSLYCSHSSLSSQSLPHPSPAVTVPSPHSPSLYCSHSSLSSQSLQHSSPAVTVPSPHSSAPSLSCSHSPLSSQFRPLPFSIFTKRNEDVAVDVELNCYTSGQ